MPTFVDGKKIAADILTDLRKEVSELKAKPQLAAILVGSDPASVSFLNEKRKRCEETDIGFTLYRYPVEVTTTKLRRHIREIRKRRSAVSLIIQLPLPPHINTQYILDAVPPGEDADALSSASKGLIATGKSKVLPPTAAAILHILAFYAIALETSHCVLVGLGALVGKPLSGILADKVASLTAVHSKTPNISRFIKEADILIAGAGHPNLIRGGMVKEGVVAIDAGYSKIGGKIIGDFVYEEISQKARLITPVPGGVGPVAVAMLLRNVVTLAKHRL